MFVEKQTNSTNLLVHLRLYYYSWYNYLFLSQLFACRAVLRSSMRRRAPVTEFTDRSWALFSVATSKSSLLTFFQDFISNEFEIKLVLSGMSPKITDFCLFSVENLTRSRKNGTCHFGSTLLRRSDSLPPRFVHWRAHVAFSELLALVFGSTGKF